MKKALPIIVVAVIVIAGAVAYLALHKNNTTSNTSTKTTTSQSSSSQQTQTTNKVTISNFAFSPANITVKKGTTVTWTNEDSVAHTVTETDSQNGPDSGSLEKGKTYTFTYNTVGTFKYHCAVHPEMVGSVTVTE